MSGSEERPVVTAASPAGPAGTWPDRGPRVSLVQLYLRLAVAPERVQDTVQALRAVMSPARFHPECAGVRLTADVENPTVLVYSEDWRTLEVLTREFRSSRFAQLAQIMESSIESPTLEIRLVSEIRGLEYVEEQWAR